MDDEVKPSFEEIYAKLRTSYLERLRDNLAFIQNAAKKAGNEAVERDDLDVMVSLAHGLAGSGTTFGFPEVTNAGRKTEALASKLSKALKDDELLLGDALEEYQGSLEELANVCEQAQSLAKTPEAEPSPHEKTAPLMLDGKKRINVLVVDDDRSLTSLISLKLTQRNFGVMTAHNGHEALQAIQKRRPDLVILDINMPGLNGHDVLRAMKQDPVLSAIPVLMLTASGKQQDVVGALHAGAMDYIMKPIDINDLVVRIEKLQRHLSRTILVADNDQLILTLLNHKFLSHGLNVVLADNGVSAVFEARKHKPDMIILDLKMPGMGGLEVMKELQLRDETKDIPVMVLSASKSAADSEAAKLAGAIDYVNKPFVADLILSRCMKILNKEN